jgi:mannose/fructose/N-acetylgalactosamine-specific phosphotransferase system component IID
MYIVPIGWLYVALMMSVAEATNTNGSVLGGILTFILYGILPTSIMVYLMRTPERKKARLALEKAQTESAQVQVDNKTTTTTNSETNVTKS